MLNTLCYYEQLVSRVRSTALVDNVPSFKLRILNIFLYSPVNDSSVVMCCARIMQHRTKKRIFPQVTTSLLLTGHHQFYWYVHQLFAITENAGKLLVSGSMSPAVNHWRKLLSTIGQVVVLRRQPHARRH